VPLECSPSKAFRAGQRADITILDVVYAAGFVVPARLIADGWVVIGIADVANWIRTRTVA